jgi:murein DD-endopeptidase MepM/ murein hydrolase activator NlpD
MDESKQLPHRNRFMNLPLVRTKVRQFDRWGSGEFEASRGERKHKGIDIEARAGWEVLSVCDGRVTKIGYPYSQAEPESFKSEDDRREFQLRKKMRYVEVTTGLGERVRYFYVSPTVMVGDIVKAGRTLGLVQDIVEIYPGITPHFHFEVLTAGGGVINPYRFLEERK